MMKLDSDKRVLVKEVAKLEQLIDQQTKQTEQLVLENQSLKKTVDALERQRAMEGATTPRQMSCGVEAGSQVPPSPTLSCHSPFTIPAYRDQDAELADASTTTSNVERARHHPGSVTAKAMDKVVDWEGTFAIAYLYTKNSSGTKISEFLKAHLAQFGLSPADAYRLVSLLTHDTDGLKAMARDMRVAVVMWGAHEVAAVALVPGRKTGGIRLRMLGSAGICEVNKLCKLDALHGEVVVHVVMKNGTGKAFRVAACSALGTFTDIGEVDKT